MAIHPISKHLEELSVAETIIVSLIDNQQISGSDAIELMKAIWGTQNKKSDPLAPHPKDLPTSPNNPVLPTPPPWTVGPDTSSPYDPFKIWFEQNHNKYDGLTNQYRVEDNCNVTTTCNQKDLPPETNSNVNSITSDKIDNEMTRVSGNDFPFPESKVFSKKK